jgi:hypothetical protein
MADQGSSSRRLLAVRDRFAEPARRLADDWDSGKDGALHHGWFGQRVRYDSDRMIAVPEELVEEAHRGRPLFWEADW